MLKVDTRCPRCFRANMRRNDGSYKPHKRLTVEGLKTGARFVQCVDYTRANATRMPMGPIGPMVG